MCGCNSYNQFICSVATLKMNEAHLKAPSAWRSAGVLQKMITDLWGSIPKGFLNGLVLRLICASGLGPTMCRKTVVRRHSLMQQPKSRFKWSLSYLDRGLCLTGYQRPHDGKQIALTTHFLLPWVVHLKPNSKHSRPSSSTRWVVIIFCRWQRPMPHRLPKTTWRETNRFDHSLLAASVECFHQLDSL